MSSNGTLGVFGNWFISNVSDVIPSHNTTIYQGNETWWGDATSAIITNTTDAANETGLYNDIVEVVAASDANPVQMKQVWFTLRIGLIVSFGRFLESFICCC